MFSTIYKKFDVFLLYSSFSFKTFIFLPENKFLLNFKLGGSVFYIEKLFNMLIAIQISFLNINVMTLISLFRCRNPNRLLFYTCWYKNGFLENHQIDDKVTNLTKSHSCCLNMLYTFMHLKSTPYICFTSLPKILLLFWFCRLFQAM